MRQRTHEWFMARCGKVTASEVANVMAFLKKGGETAARFNYKIQLVSEILTGQPDMDGYLSPAMQWGIDVEDEARAEYELATGNVVNLEGFLQHPRIERAGASPDGLIGEDGLLELKCPKTKTHIGWLLADLVPEEYQEQMFFQMACSGREWCDFASYDPRLPKQLQLFVKRLHWDDARIVAIEEAVLTFLSEVDALIEQLRNAVGGFDLPKVPVLSGVDPLMDSMYLTDADFEGLI